MRWVILLCLAGLIAPATARAGAWPQGKGNVFLSFSYEWTTTRDQALYQITGDPTHVDKTIETPEEADIPFEDFGYMAVYGEWGLTDRLTLGIDAGQEEAPDTFQWIVFASVAVTPPDWRLTASLEFGVGRREFPADPDDRALIQFLRDSGEEIVLRPGFAVGYGFDSRFGAGWVALNMRQELRQERDETVQKADLTLGLSRGDKALIYLQAQYSDYPLAEPNLRLVPTYVRKLSDRVSWEAGLLYDAVGGDRIGVRTGLWLRF